MKGRLVYGEPGGVTNMGRFESTDVRGSPYRVAVIGAEVPVGSELLERFGPYRAEVATLEDVARLIAIGVTAVVVFATEQRRAVEAVRSVRASSARVPVLVVTPSLSGFDSGELADVGATEHLAYAAASSNPLGLVVQTVRRVQLLRSRLASVELECRAQHEAVEARRAASEKTLLAVRDIATGLLLAMHELRDVGASGIVEASLLDSMESSLRRMRDLLGPLEALVVPPATDGIEPNEERITR